MKISRPATSLPPLTSPFKIFLGKTILTPWRPRLSDWARSLAWLERSTDNRVVGGSNPPGPILLDLAASRSGVNPDFGCLVRPSCAGARSDRLEIVSGG